MKYLVLFFTLIFCTCSMAQVGDLFPEMEAETLTNKSVNIPKNLTGKYSLICLAYTKKSEDQLATWFQPIYNQFIYKSPTPSLFAGDFDINVYFIPMFTGAKRPAYQKVMKKVKKTVDPKLQPYVLFYKGTLKHYKNALNFQGRDLPYFFVLDPNGKILYTTNGRHTDGKMREIVDAVEASYN